MTDLAARDEAIKEHYRGEKPWRTFLTLYRRDRRRLAAAVLLYLVKQSPVWVMPIVTANIIDVISRPDRHRLSELWVNALVGAAFILQNLPTHFLYHQSLSRAIRNVEVRLRAGLCRRLQELSISYYRHTSTGALQTKVLRDVDALEQLVRQLFDVCLGACTVIVAAVLVTARRTPQLLPVFLLTTPLFALLHLLLRRALGDLNRRFRTDFEAMSARVLGMIDLIPVTRAHGVEEDELARVGTELHRVRRTALELDVRSGFFSAVSWISWSLCNLLWLALGGWVCYRQIYPVTPGDVVLLTGYFNSFVAAVTQINGTLPLILRGFESVRSIGEVLGSPDVEDNRGKPRVTAVRGEIEFRRVSLRYPHAARDAVTDFSLHVRPGERIGLVGPSGSGKSTVLSLLLGFERPTQGAVFVDGVDAREIDLRSVRRFVAVVAQETILFPGTVRENILYGCPQASEAELREAVDAANAREFVDALPQGLDTPLGERGARLSGGQRQRLAIARALVRDPRILILDEATSALDAVAEAVLRETLDRLMVGRTTFIVAHRLSTLSGADRILVLEEGRTVETGSPAELLRRGGRFAGLHALQADALAR